MKSDLNNNQRPFQIALSVIIILGLFALYSYRERMLFIDPCWIVFNIINTKTFCFAEHRYGAFITQSFPLIGVYLRLSLKTVLILYSASFYIFYSAAAIIMGFVWRQKWAAVLLALYLVLFISDGYYWPNNEVHQGIAWMLLFFALYVYKSDKERLSLGNHFALIMLGFLALSSHVIVSIPFVFLWAYIHLEKPMRLLFKDRRFIGYTVAVVCLMLARYIMSANYGWYDTDKLTPVKNITLHSVLHSFTSPQAKSILSLIATRYWLAIPLLLFGLIFLLRAKKYRQAILVVICSVGYFVLICLVYPEAFSRNFRFYMESEWAALSIIIALPFVHLLPHYLSSKKQTALIFMVIFAIRLAYIFDAYHDFSGRYKHLEQITHSLQNKGIKKAVIIA